MKKVELLSGAGDMETLKMAIKCGCDAVYVSLKDYGARKYAKNFTLEEMKEATRYCHLYGVRIYVTVNTLIYDREIEGALDTISSLEKIGVDALIMQDIGLISLVRRKFPNMEIHVSTQAHNCSNECVRFWEKLGVKRVVLARELSLEEIKNISTSLELEAFIHGALCVSYSGQCLISSRLFGRSGNRGECAQVCRFLFDMYKGDKKESSGYLLSTKDLFTGSMISDLINAGISSLKIEGRMKSKYYVGVVTRFYRKLIDMYYSGEKLTFSEDDYKDLLTVYNREFTCGFLGDEKNIVNSRTCNHQGSMLGEVINCGKRIKIKLFSSVTQGDGIRFSNGEGMICNYIYDEKGLLINSASSKDIVYVDNKVNLKETGFVYKTLDVVLNKRIDDLPDKKIPVRFKFNAFVGKPVSMSIMCDGDEISLSSGMTESSINSPISKEQIIARLSKLGDTPFVMEDCDIMLDDNIFVPVKVINELRRKLVSKLITLRENKSYDKVLGNENISSFKNEITEGFSFLVRTEDQIKALLSKDVNIYVDNYNLYKKYKGDNIFYRPLRASHDNRECSKCLVTNNGYLNNSYKDSVSDIYMNVFNSLSLAFYSKYVSKVGLSPELSNYDISELISSFNNRFGFLPNVEVLIYGKPELMIMKYCPIRKDVSDKCSLCISNNYYLDDRKGNRYRLYRDSSHKVRVIDSQNIDKISDISYLKSIGVTNFRIDLLDESYDEVISILDKLSCI